MSFDNWVHWASWILPISAVLVKFLLIRKAKRGNQNSRPLIWVEYLPSFVCFVTMCLWLADELVSQDSSRTVDVLVWGAVAFLFFPRQKNQVATGNK